MFATVIAWLRDWAYKLQESHADACEFGVSLSTLDFASADSNVVGFLNCAAQT